MAQPTQSYKNHTRFYPLFHFFVIPVLVLHFFNTIRHVWLAPNQSTLFAMVVASALIGLALSARMMALAVQDRLIRLEMQLRLRTVLPAGLQDSIAALTHKQLVALRFASDEEMPSLIGEVLAGKLPTQRAIKQRIQQWQADHLRA